MPYMADHFQRVTGLWVTGLEAYIGWIKPGSYFHWIVAQKGQLGLCHHLTSLDPMMPPPQEVSGGTTHSTSGSGARPNTPFTLRVQRGPKLLPPLGMWLSLKPAPLLGVELKSPWKLVGLGVVPPGETKWMPQSGQAEPGENVPGPLPGSESTSPQFPSHSKMKGNAERQLTSSTGMLGKWDHQPIRRPSEGCGYAIQTVSLRH